MSQGGGGAGGSQKLAPRTDAELADELADRVNRLRPARSDPEAFHVEKDEIARSLRRMARRLEGNNLSGRDRRDAPRR